MQWIEYKNCRIAVSPAHQGAGCWGAIYHVAHDRMGSTAQGMLEGSQPSAEEAIMRATRIVKVAINETTDFAHGFPVSMSRLNEQFAL